MYKDKSLINKDEVGGYATKFKCKPDAIRLAKIIVGESTNSVEEIINEIRNSANNNLLNGGDMVQFSIPIDLLFNAKDLEG